MKRKGLSGEEREEMEIRGQIFKIQLLDEK